MGYAVIHIHHVDGEERKVRGGIRRRRVERVNLLKQVECVSTVLSPTEQRNQGVEHTVEPHGCPRVGSMHRGDDTPERREKVTGGSVFMNHGEAIKMGAGDITMTNRIISLIIDDIDIFELQD